MRVTQKCQYALRAMLELTLSGGQGPIKIAEIARRQDIPPRFLETILSELNQAGFVDSRRGSTGGYYLARSSKKITVGDVVRFVEGKQGGKWDELRESRGDCVFITLWQRAEDAVNDIFDNTTFESLAEEKRARDTEYVLDFVI